MLLVQYLNLLSNTITSLVKESGETGERSFQTGNKTEQNRIE